MSYKVRYTFNMLWENLISTRRPFLKFSNNQFDFYFIGGFQKKRCIDVWWYEISVGDSITIYFRGKWLSNIRKIVIESLGNPNLVSLCLIIYNELIRYSTVFVLVDYFLNDCPNFPEIVFVVYNLALIEVFSSSFRKDVNLFLYCLYLWTLYIVGCLREII